MAAQLKLNATSPVSLKEMAGTDYDYTTNIVLLNFASTDTGVGTLSVNPGVNTGLTSIGTFTDTYYDFDQNQHPVGTTVTTVVYNFYQDLQTAAESLTRPLEFSSTATREQDDTNLNADSITIALANLVAVGVGSYALQPTSPVGGTWVSKATITNNLDTNESNQTFLWRKTAPATTPSTIRPIKTNATSPVSIKEMSDAEIQSLTERLRNRIVATGIGKYQISATAPVSGGTWTSSGLSFIDTTRTQSPISYSGTYAGAYAGAYAGSYAQAFTGSYAGGYTRAFTGSYVGAYTGNFAGTYSRAFTGSRTVKVGAKAGFGGSNVTYTGSYVGFFTGSFATAFSGAYAAAYSRVFTGAYAGAYTGSFTGSYTGSYTGNYTGAYTGITLNNDTSNVSTIYLWVRTT